MLNLTKISTRRKTNLYCVRRWATTSKSRLYSTLQTISVGAVIGMARVVNVEKIQGNYFNKKNCAVGLKGRREQV
jgi:hypothetical protein